MSSPMKLGIRSRCSERDLVAEVSSMVNSHCIKLFRSLVVVSLHKLPNLQSTLIEDV
jgi:hypothetical protein